RSFFVTDPPTTDIYTLSLHDALPICHDDVVLHGHRHAGQGTGSFARGQATVERARRFQRELGKHGDVGVESLGGLDALQGCLDQDRKSTRLNSSHVKISYAVFCLKKK